MLRYLSGVDDVFTLTHYLLLVIVGFGVVLLVMNVKVVASALNSTVLFNDQTIITEHRLPTILQTFLVSYHPV